MFVSRILPLLLYVVFKVCCLILFVAPRGAGVHLSPLCSSLVHSLPHLLLFFTFSFFPFSTRFTYLLLLSFPFYLNSPTLFPGRRS